MTAIKPSVFCSFVFAALSTTQTDAFARYEHHGHGAGEFAAQDFSRRDIPESGGHKFHAVLGYDTEERHKSDIDAMGHDPAEPEIARVDRQRMSGVRVDHFQGFAHEDVVGIAHPESKTQKNEEKILDNSR